MKTYIAATFILIGPAVVFPSLPHIIGIALMSAAAVLLWLAYRMIVKITS